MKKVILKIGGMSCSACSNGLEKYLNKQDGIIGASVNLIMNNATIEYDEALVTMEDLDRFVSKAGFESLGIDDFKKDSKLQTKKKIELIVLSILFGISLISHTLEIINIEMNMIAMGIAMGILSLLSIIIGRDILYSGLVSIKLKSPGMDTLVLISVASSYLYSIYGFISNLLGDNKTLYFASCIMIIFFVKLGRYIEAKAKNKTTEAISDLMLLTPSYASLLIDGKIKKVTIDEVEKGNTLVTKSGESIAVDGVITTGVATINEALITGESMPKEKKAGDKVIAGSIVVDGYIEYKAERIGKDSTVSEIVRTVVDATKSKTKIQRVADTFSKYFVYFVVSVALIGFIIWLIVSRNFNTSINIFVTVLVVSCPCALGLATPIALVVASGKCAKSGILVKDNSIFEVLPKTKNIVFDKTGTITLGNLKIEDELYFNDDKEELLSYIYSIEKKSPHPIAVAITKELEARNSKELVVEDFQNVVGKGVTGIINNRKILIGNLEMIKENNIDISTKNSEIEHYLNSGKTIIIVTIDNKLEAILTLVDEVRSGSSTLINNLKQKGINAILLSGDNLATCNALDAKLHFSKVIANATPIDKANFIDKTKEEGVLVMVGDGINDAISIAKSDVGVSISGASDIAINSANCIIMNNNIASINTLLNISKKTIIVVKENITWAFFYNTIMISLALGALSFIGITLNPMIASLFMVLSSITVILNALRINRVK